MARPEWGMPGPEIGGSEVSLARFCGHLLPTTTEPGSARRGIRIQGPWEIPAIWRSRICGNLEIRRKYDTGGHGEPCGGFAAGLGPETRGLTAWNRAAGVRCRGPNRRPG